MRDSEAHGGSGEHRSCKTLFNFHNYKYIEPFASGNAQNYFAGLMTTSSTSTTD
jgi:hypothetical protein